MKKCRIMCLMLSAVVFLSGCGESPAEIVEEVVELHEPKASKTDTEDTAQGLTEPVVRRDLFIEDVYEVVVYPYMEKYSFDSTHIFEAYGAMAGDTVQKGDQLLYTENSALRKQIESMEETLEKMAESYEEYRKEAEETLSGQRKELEKLQEILDNLEDQEPEQYILGENNVQTANPLYASWEREYNRYQGQYNKMDLTINMGEEALRQRGELYELDYSYNQRQLQELEDKEKEDGIFAQFSGQVVAMAELSPSETIPASKDVIAVADTERKIVMCGGMTETIRRSAKDIYAVVNGKRYELELMDGESVAGSYYVTFSVSDDNDELEIGDRGAVVAMREYREQALSVPVSAIVTENYVNSVYVLEDGEFVPRQVQTGITDGVYIEVRSGLEEGEVVQVSQTIITAGTGSKTTVLEKADTGNPFGANGTVLYLTRVMERNPIEHGTVYFESYETTIYDYVEAGDVIARISVIGDSLLLAEKEINLRRAKERLDDIIAQGLEENEKLIAQRQEAIAEMEEELAEILADYGATEIRATASGRVLFQREHYMGDEIQPGESLAIIAEEDKGYLKVDGGGGGSRKLRLNYGDVLTIRYNDSDGEQQYIEGKVATLWMPGLGDLATDTALIRLSEEDAEKIDAVNTGATLVDKRYGIKSITSFYIAGTVEKVKNVIVVPMEAVTLTENRCYVNVRREDGSVVAVGFIAGGIVNGCYWVVEGLTEGMEICWE